MLSSTLVATLLKPLLKVASSKFEEIYENKVVELPTSTDIDGVVRLIDYVPRSRYEYTSQATSDAQ
jgi:hypothetical protein